ncbi:universal stress protein [Desulfonema ishimotonii]|uniref:Universal stress protein n=1 Tax=Desulfonema ishimotonii TaxID=45657 RepID=A0A401FX72_9BACT|nr:universal stress protein [Desulfonema ishimotonii]GBC61602.1 universal stress protein [Desulfonema ishimotonii]
MEEFKKILVALGISEYSEGIYRYAVKLATALESELIVVNVIHARDVEAVASISSMGYQVNGAHYIQGVREERKRFLSAIMNQAPFPEDRVRVLIRVGNPMDQLLKTIVQENADMVVMGPKGRTDLEHVLVGSVALKLFRRSPVTVVSYRDEKLAARLRKKIHPES